MTALSPGRAVVARAAPGVRVDSDVGRLARVLVHRPGRELAAVHAHDADAMLFDSPVSVARARREHDGFVAALRWAGAEVLYVDGLLDDVLAAEGESAPFPWRGSGGGRFSRFPGSSWRLPPLPNLMFTRDPMTVVGDGLHVARLACTARKAELGVARRLAEHPALRATHRWSDGDLGVEGGDVLTAGDGVLVVGVGPRTGLEAVQRLADRLFAAGWAREVIAAMMPPGGPFHLDLALTMVARDTVLVDHGVIDRTATLRLRPGSPPRPGDGLLAEMARALELPRLRDIPATDAGHGRSWDHGANVLAVAEGVVVAYADNSATNARLRRAGVEVLDVDGSTLGRGRGGPRCLSCPLVRDPLEPS